MQPDSTVGRSAQLWAKRIEYGSTMLCRALACAFARAGSRSWIFQYKIGREDMAAR